MFRKQVLGIFQKFAFVPMNQYITVYKAISLKICDALVKMKQLSQAQGLQNFPEKANAN